MLAYREWTVFMDGGEPTLQSVSVLTAWPNAVMEADGRPTASNSLGLHAYAPWIAKAMEPRQFRDVLVVGAIDASGVIAIHEDGVMRAERARILALHVVPP